MFDGWLHEKKWYPVFSREHFRYLWNPSSSNGAYSVESNFHAIIILSDVYSAETYFSNDGIGFISLTTAEFYSLTLQECHLATWQLSKCLANFSPEKLTPNFSESPDCHMVVLYVLSILLHGLFVTCLFPYWNFIQTQISLQICHCRPADISSFKCSKTLECMTIKGSLPSLLQKNYI